MLNGIQKFIVWTDSSTEITSEMLVMGLRKELPAVAVMAAPVGLDTRCLTDQDIAEYDR